ncbi:MAG TPA: ABC transporter ATP-binding protein [Streptosporangiaceae bacterium]|jgi:branched-chain amino acid transport system ATP-binding protein
MLEVRGLTAGYGKVLVVWDVDLTVAEREIVALVGPNGAGKSTLLRAVSGMIPIHDGSVTLAGRSLSGLPIEDIVDLGVAHVPEGRRLFPGLTVRQNLLVGGWRKKQQDIEPVLELFPQLGKRLSQLAGSLSGGEQQMCAIARGLMNRPPLMMIDELSLGLAPVVVDEIVDKLPRIAADGTAVLLVEQDVDTALSLASRAYVLEAGRIVLTGSAADLLADTRIRESYLGI